MKGSVTSLLLVACLFAFPARGQRSTSADQPGFHVRSGMFTVQAGGREMFVEHFKGIHYADFTLIGPAAVEVSFAGRVDSVRLSPLSRGIGARIETGRVRFTLPGPGWYVLEVNGREKLFLLADTPDKGPGRKLISVLDYVADTTGTVLQTAALQRALDAAAGSGRVLYFPRGVYLTGALTVHGQTDIYLADGAMIKGSADRADYPADEGRAEADHINDREHYSDNGEFMTFSRLVLIDNAAGVRIRGRGTIDGSGALVRAQGKPANLVRIRNSQDVLIEGIILRDPAAWNTHILYSEGVTVRGVKLLNDPEVHNTDGFDPDASRRVLIEGCFAYCSDDNVAIKTTGNGGLLQNLEDVTVRGCVFLTRKSSLKVGTETKALSMRRILFEDNDVVLCDRALALYCNDGACLEGVRFVNNRIERNHPDSQRRAVHFSIRNRYGSGTMRDILVRDCSFLEAFPRGSIVEGLDAQHTVDGLTFENVTVAGRKMTSLADLGIKHTPFVTHIEIR